jgi:hypothetical protein
MCKTKLPLGFLIFAAAAAVSAGCAKQSAADDTTDVPGGGGQVATTRGQGGAAAGGGGISGGGAAGSVMPGNTGGAGGDPGPVDGPVTDPTTGDAAIVDAPISDDSAGSPVDANAIGGFHPIVPDAAPWQMMCPDGADRADCCALYCTCMTKFCPATIPSACVQACVAAKNWDLVCRTYQCFASQNPNFPQDHDSHCKHAIGGLGKCGNR